MRESVSGSQRYVISIIENNTPHRFKGKTVSQARAFINKHMDESKEASKRFKEGKARKKFNSICYETLVAQSIVEEVVKDIPPSFIDAGDYEWGTGLGDVTGERQNNGHHGMPDDY